MEQKNTEDIDYWLFAPAGWAAFARARNDVPLEIVADVSEEEAERICAKIKDRLKEDVFDTLYVRILVYFHDKSAIEILQKWLRHFKEKHRVFKRKGIDCSIEIRLLKDAIKQLKHH